MYAIKRKYHFGFVVLTPAVFGDSKALCGQTVDVIIDGELERRPFAGFIEGQNPFRKSLPCSITNIIGFNTSGFPYISSWQELNAAQTFEGIEYEGNCYLLVQSNTLVVNGRYESSKREKAKVISLFK